MVQHLQEQGFQSKTPAFSKETTYFQIIIFFFLTTNKERVILGKTCMLDLTLKDFARLYGRTGRQCTGTTLVSSVPVPTRPLSPPSTTVDTTTRNSQVHTK